MLFYSHYIFDVINLCHSSCETPDPFAPNWTVNFLEILHACHQEVPGPMKMHSLFLPQGLHFLFDDGPLFYWDPEN